MGTGQRGGYRFCAPDLQTIKLVQQKIAYSFNYEFIKDEDHLVRVRGDLQGVEWVSVDTETTSLNYDKMDLVAISIATKDKTYCIVVKHNECRSDISYENLSSFICWVFEKKLIKFNARFDYRVIAKFFPDIRKQSFPFIIDVQVLIFIADSNISLPSLKQSSLDFLGIKQPGFDDSWLGDNIKNSNFKDFVYYSCFDARTTYDLWDLFYPEMQSKYTFILEVYRRLVKPIMDFEDIEMTIDFEYLKAMSVQVRERREKLKEIIWEQLGVFNIGSSVQLRKKLQAAGLNTGVMTKPSKTFERGQMSVGIKALPNIKGVKFVDWIIEYSKLGKLQSTYVDSMLQRRDRGLPVKFAYRLCNVPSGRLAAGKFETLTKKNKNTSCFIDMNIQSIVQPPTKIRQLNFNSDTFEIQWADDGKYVVEAGVLNLNFRKSFLPPSKDFIWLSTDFSSQEMVIAANLSKEPVWIEAFKNHEDLHKKVAYLVFGKENYNKEKRKLAKNINFLVLYGGNGWTIHKNLGIKQEDADWYYEEFTKTLNVYFKKWFPAVTKSAKRLGYVINDLGFPRKLKWYYKMGGKKAMYADRSAVNHKVQGTCAVIIELVLIKVHALIERKYKGDVIFQSCIHDEVNFVVRKTRLLEFIIDLNDIMTHLTPKEYILPLEVQNSIGDNWGEIFKINIIDGKIVPKEEG
jgi:DNA polymerase I